MRKTPLVRLPPNFSHSPPPPPPPPPAAQQPPDKSQDPEVSGKLDLLCVLQITLSFTCVHVDLRFFPPFKLYFYRLVASWLRMEAHFCHFVTQYPASPHGKRSQNNGSTIQNTDNSDLFYK